jgi:hypothetical protein
MGAACMFRIHGEKVVAGTPLPGATGVGKAGVGVDSG